ncbi:hypothetical protein ACUH78_19945, partial [Thauera sp. ZXT1-4]|uniref:hypothetical protein n=1 Tax=Thauera sp. ZXT1-4 TaxID=3460294 RepID=UPI00404095AA
MARAAATRPPSADRLPRGAERVLRLLGDARLGVALLLVATLANVAAAILPWADALLRGWPYALLLGAVV